MLSPGYTYDKAPDQEHFLTRKKTRNLFSQILSNRSEKWRFNLSPLFLEYLMGKRNYKCTPWGMPTYNIFGWQKPCYLLQDGYADTFDELISETNWENYGTESGNPKCANCMVHSGYEASAVNDTFSSVGGFLATVRATLFNKYKDPDAMGGASGRSDQRFRSAGADHDVAQSLAFQSAMAELHRTSPAENDEEHLGFRPRKSGRLDSFDFHRCRNSRGPGKGVRLPRRFDDHAEKRAENRRVLIRSQNKGTFARGMFRSPDAEGRQRQSFGALQRNCRPRIHRPRYGRRQELRRVGEEVQRKESRRRDERRHRRRTSRLASFPFAPQTVRFLWSDFPVLYP